MSAAQFGCELFPLSSVSVGSGTYTQIVGDLNGDGAPDVAVARTQDKLAVLLNDGNGGFSLGPDYPVPAHPRDLAIRDVDGDGDNDLLSLNFESGSMSVLRNDGSGSLLPAQTVACGPSPVSFELGDVDGDGDLDAIVVNGLATDGTISLMRNQGQGVFFKAYSKIVGKSPAFVALGRLNSDNSLDVAVTYRATAANYATMGAFFNDGSGVFGPLVQELQSTTATFSAVLIADLEGDDDEDIFVTSGSFVYRLMNDGSGGFKVESDPVLGGVNPVIGDVDGDGQPDLVAMASSTGASSRSIYFTAVEDDGSFESLEVLWAVDTPTSVGIADMDVDGNVDVFVSHSSGFTFLRNDGSSEFKSRLVGEVMVLSNHILGKMISCDVDQDGDVDLVTGNSVSQGSSFSVVRNEGNLAFSAPQWFTYGSNSGFSDMALFDMNADGVRDAIIAGDNSYIYIMNGVAGGSFVGPAAQYWTGGPIGQLAVHDLDGDGDCDVAVAESTDQTPGVINLHSNHAGVLSRPTQVLCKSSPTGVSAGDMSGDGVADLVVANNSAGDDIPSVTVHLNWGNGVFESASSVALDGRPNDVALHDLDGDGNLDVVVTLPLTATGGLGVRIAVIRNQGLGQLAAPTYYNTGTYPLFVKIQDVNGDDRPEIVTAHYETSGISVLMNQGDGLFISERHETVRDPLGLAVDDFSGDGLPDIAIFHQGEDKLGLLLNQGQFAAILQQPQDVIVESGNQAAFTVSTDPAEGLYYQWMKNDIEVRDGDGVAGSATPVLTIGEVSNDDAGEYRVRISSGSCSFDSQAAILEVLAGCVADVSPIDGDDQINVDDLLVIINAWGPCPECQGDLDSNGMVDVDDLLSVINAWGPCR